jgi:hypothetical protein
MFLNRAFKQDPGLTDFGVNYYGFLESEEYKNWLKSIEGQILTSDMYNSPYFGFQSSGAYSELDRIYEIYKANYLLSGTFDPIKVISQQECPDGYLYFNESCVRGLDPIDPTDPTIKRVTTTASTISPALILAVAAAFFFAG